MLRPHALQLAGLHVVQKQRRDWHGACDQVSLLVLLTAVVAGFDRGRKDVVEASEGGGEDEVHRVVVGGLADQVEDGEGGIQGKSKQSC